MPIMWRASSGIEGAGHRRGSLSHAGRRSAEPGPGAVRRRPAPGAPIDSGVLRFARRKAPAVDWTIVKQGQRLYLSARNNGDSRLRVSRFRCAIRGEIRSRLGLAWLAMCSVVRPALGRAGRRRATESRGSHIAFRARQPRRNPCDCRGSEGSLGSPSLACLLGATVLLVQISQTVLAAEALQLEVFINGVSTDKIGAFVLRREQIGAERDELRELGLSLQGA